MDARELRVKDPLPGWRGHFFRYEQMTFAYYEIDADAVPLHQHDHSQEEVRYVIDGRLAGC